jgi:hypothetical protein
MVQPYLHSLDTQGEVDLIFIAGVYSHAVHKQPALRPGDGVVDEPWRRMAWSGVTAPTPAQLDVAERAMQMVADRFDDRPAYGRVDLVADQRDDPVVLEVELIDPYLSLDMVPSAAARLADAILPR